MPVKLASEFREFLLRQNALALAVGVVLGAAVTKVVTGVVDDLLMPVLGVMLPGGEWRSWQVPLDSENALKLGDLLGRLVDFAIVALVVFLVTKALLREKPKAAPATKTCAACLEVVPVAATRCRACTSTLTVA